MSRLCTVCSHPQRPAIDLALVQHHTSYRGIARQFQVTDDALLRHEHSHLRLSWHASKELAIMLSAENLLHELADLHRETRELLAEARQSGDIRTALAAIREARSTVESYAHIGPMADIEERLQALEEGGDHNGTTR